MTWTPLQILGSPSKPPSETPRAYLRRVDKWSCQKMAELRKGLRAKDDKSPLRRCWDGFTLIVEAGSNI